MNILLTGGSGFLGSALALSLCEQGHQVALLLRPNSSLDRLKGRASRFEIGRCQNDAELMGFVAQVRPDAVVHTACSYGRGGETALQVSDANVRLGLVLLQSLARQETPVTFINTGTVLDANVSPYALSKHQFVQWGCAAAEQSAGKLRFINVLLQHMYGPGDDASKFTTHVLRTCYHQEPTLKLTAGEQMRDFIYIEDVVSAYVTLLNSADLLDQACDIEVGSGRAPSIREFVETVHKLTQSRTELQFGAIPYRANEAMHCQANIERLQTLGWQPVFDLTRGLNKTIELEFSR